MKTLWTLFTACLLALLAACQNTPASWSQTPARHKEPEYVLQSFREALETGNQPMLVDCFSLAGADAARIRTMSTVALAPRTLRQTAMLAYGSAGSDAFDDDRIYGAWAPFMHGMKALRYVDLTNKARSVQGMYAVVPIREPEVPLDAWHLVKDKQGWRIDLRRTMLQHAGAPELEARWWQALAAVAEACDQVNMAMQRGQATSPSDGVMMLQQRLAAIPVPPTARTLIPTTSTMPATTSAAPAVPTTKP